MWYVAGPVKDAEGTCEAVMWQVIPLWERLNWELPSSLLTIFSYDGSVDRGDMPGLAGWDERGLPLMDGGVAARVRVGLTQKDLFLRWRREDLGSGEKI